jgi:hypothetical protein
VQPDVFSKNLGFLCVPETINGRFMFLNQLQRYHLAHLGILELRMKLRLALSRLCLSGLLSALEPSVQTAKFACELLVPDSLFLLFLSCITADDMLPNFEFSIRRVVCISPSVVTSLSLFDNLVFEEETGDSAARCVCSEA